MSFWIVLRPKSKSIRFNPISPILIALLLMTSFGCSQKSSDQDDKLANRGEQQSNVQSGAQKNSPLENGARLAQVISRGSLICGVNGQLPGFSFVDERGQYSGLDVDFCRALAAALFDNPQKIEFQDLGAQERFTAVQSGKVDLLSRNTTWTISRDTAAGMEFAPTTFYDGQGLLVNNSNMIEKLEDLDGRSVCILSGTTNEQNLSEHMRKLGLNYAPVVFEDSDLLYSAYEQGRCEAVTSDRSQLTVRRAIMSKPENHQILDEVLSKEPLGPLIADGDPKWFDVVKWVAYTLIQAEELGINSENIDSFAKTKDPKIRRFLGLEDDLGKKIGLSNDFTKRIIKHVGNYEEVYERNIGKPFGLERGLNALWKDGGLMYSPPFK